MATRRKLTSLIDRAVTEQPLNKAFLADLMQCIEQIDLKGRRKPSTYYKPSSMVCMRQMYFQRIGKEPDANRSEYTSIGMADTGSRRHEAIQDALLKMKSLGYDWEYLDVAEYIKEQQSHGRCSQIVIKGKRGIETHLIDTALNISFMCDGIIQRISTGHCYLFEFKNQVSFKFNNKESVDKEHIPQVSCYCTSLELDDAFVLYENRDTCNLECPEIFRVTEEMKASAISKIFECEGYVERLIPPPAHPDTKPCRWCGYISSCKKAGK